MSRRYGLVEFRRNGVDVKRGVVGKHVYEDLDIIFGGGVEHFLHLLFGADNLIPDFPVGGLIVIIPIAFLLVKEFL